MKNVKEKDKHRVMMIEKILKLEVSYEAPFHERYHTLKKKWTK